MKKTTTCTLACTLLATFAGAAIGGIQVDWYRTTAPNIYGSGSYDAFWSNVQDSIINNNGANTGSGNSAFTNLSSVTGMQSYVTSFESLNGTYAAGEYGVRPSWVYYISNDDGSTMTYNETFAGATRNYSYSWGGTEESFWGDVDFGSMAALGRIGVRADGTTGLDPDEEYVGFLAISGIAWWAQNWTGTLGVDHAWIDGDFLVGDPDRFDKLAELAAYVEANQDYWAFSITIDGITFDAPNINVVPIPPAALAGLAMLTGIAGVRTIRRRA